MPTVITVVIDPLDQQSTQEDKHLLVQCLKQGKGELSNLFQILHYFLQKKEQKTGRQAILSIHKGNQLFPQTSAYFASSFSSILMNSKFLRKTLTGLKKVGKFFSASLLIL